jgi:hypothetical protein
MLWRAKSGHHDDEPHLLELDSLQKKWPTKDGFTAANVADVINAYDQPLSYTLRDFLYPTATVEFKASAKSVTRCLKGHLNNAIKNADRVLILRSDKRSADHLTFFVEVKEEEMKVPPKFD